MHIIRNIHTLFLPPPPVPPPVIREVEGSRGEQFRTVGANDSVAAPGTPVSPSSGSKSDFHPLRAAIREAWIFRAIVRPLSNDTRGMARVGPRERILSQQLEGCDNPVERFTAGFPERGE